MRKGWTTSASAKTGAGREVTCAVDAAGISGGAQTFNINFTWMELLRLARSILVVLCSRTVDRKELFTLVAHRKTGKVGILALKKDRFKGERKNGRTR